MKQLSRHDMYINILEDEKTGINKVREMLQTIIENVPAPITENDWSLDCYKRRQLNYYHNIALLSNIIKNKLNKEIK